MSCLLVLSHTYWTVQKQPSHLDSLQISNITGDLYNVGEHGLLCHTASVKNSFSDKALKCDM